MVLGLASRPHPGSSLRSSRQNWRLARRRPDGYNDHMKKQSSFVGSRELKTRLGSYLERVRRGETLVVTDRGEPVAELRPVMRAENPADAALRRLAAEGLVTLGTGAPLRGFRAIRLRGGGSAADAISDDRDDRF